VNTYLVAGTLIIRACCRAGSQCLSGRKL